MAALRAAQLLLLLLLTFGAGATVRASAATLIRKCCPPRQQLDFAATACVPYAGAVAVAADAAEESVSAVLERSPGGVPWWMNSSTPVYDEGSRNRLNRSFLDGHTAAEVVRYGPRPPCPRDQAKIFMWQSSSRYRLLANGTLFVRTEGAKLPNMALSPDEYCVDRLDGPNEMHVFLACPCNKTVCINKCCSRSKEQVINVSRRNVNYECVDVQDSNLRWKPQFFASNGSKEVLEDVKYIVLDANVPTCRDGYGAVMLNDDSSSNKSMWILANGSAVMEGYGHGAAFPRDMWCADNALLDGGGRVRNAIVCHEMMPRERFSTTATVYGSLFAVNAFFLLLTLLVYAALPELRCSAYAKAMLCHVAALLAASLALASGQLRSVLDSNLECHVLGFVVQYTALATFFWLNVVCFDVACSFGRGKMLPGGRERRKFLWYSLYAWGGPAVITAITVALEFIESLPAGVVRPDIGVFSCWFNDAAAAWAFFYGPTTALLAANAVLFGVAATQLVRGRRERPLLRSAALALALFVLMGVTWLSEVISFAEGSEHVVWMVLDVINILRGVFIFIILCCRPKVFRALRQRFRGGDGDSASSGVANTAFSAVQLDAVTGSPLANGNAASRQP